MLESKSKGQDNDNSMYLRLTSLQLMKVLVSVWSQGHLCCLWCHHNAGGVFGVMKHKKGKARPREQTGTYLAVVVRGSEALTRRTLFQLSARGKQSVVNLKPVFNYMCHVMLYLRLALFNSFYLQVQFWIPYSCLFTF